MAGHREPLVVGVGGTAREGSATERLLRAALHRAGRHGARTEIVAGPALELPMYAFGACAGSDSARALVDLLGRADGVIVASPAYHGAVSGLVKNALDYAEELRAAPRPYLDGRAVGCIAAAGGWQAAGSTLAGLRAVVHALRGWPTPLGVAVNTSGPVFGPDGEIADTALVAALDVMAGQVVGFARAQAAPARPRPHHPGRRHGGPDLSTTKEIARPRKEIA